MAGLTDRVPALGIQPVPLRDALGDRTFEPLSAGI
jgi:hypothetical protein